MDPGSGGLWNPAFLGPLDGEFAPVTGAIRCFAGEERYFSLRKLTAREKLWQTIEPILGRILTEDETVLHVAPVVRNPRFLEVFGLGVWYVLFFRAALVVTDRRVVEIMLRKPDVADTCIRSYSWGQVQRVKLSFGTLTLKPAEGRTQKWKLQERGDRKLLKLLLPKIVEQLVPGDIHVPRPVPLWHCPECGLPTPKAPKLCSQCGTGFKSPGLAAGLSLAFPGAGLLYAGHPVLAVLDFIGEAMAFLIVAVMFMMASGPAEIVGAVTFGLIVLFFTKLESAHVAQVLVGRTRPEPRPSPWRRVAVIGAVVTLVLMAVPPALTGSLATFGNLVDRDLDFSANELGWSGGHDPGQWVYGSEINQRSEWIRGDGQSLFVWSVPMGANETERAFTEAVTSADGVESWEQLTIGGFDGLRVTATEIDEDGTPYLWVRWMFFDRQYDDVHILATATMPEGLEALNSEVDRLVRTASWVPATY
jgi:hypothetical protein